MKFILHFIRVHTFEKLPPYILVFKTIFKYKNILGIW